MLALAFASGGRRRSEISRLTLGALTSQPDIPDPDTGELLPSLAVSLGRTKTTDADDDTTVYVSGAPVRFVAAWIDAAEITSGPLFRRIDRWGHISNNGIGEQGLNLVLKSRIREIGEDPRRFSAHGIRSGYITEALNRGLTPQEIMGQTQHRSMKTTLEYYNARQRRTGRAARLLS